MVCVMRYIDLFSSKSQMEEARERRERARDMLAGCAREGRLSNRLETHLELAVVVKSLMASRRGPSRSSATHPTDMMWLVESISPKPPVARCEAGEIEFLELGAQTRSFESSLPTSDVDVTLLRRMRVFDREIDGNHAIATRVALTAVLDAPASKTPRFCVCGIIARSSLFLPWLVLENRGGERSERFVHASAFLFSKALKRNDREPAARILAHAVAWVAREVRKRNVKRGVSAARSYDDHMYVPIAPSHTTCA